MATWVDALFVCPKDPSRMQRVRINYSYLEDGKPIGLAVPCSNYRRDNDICLKCHAFQCTYISYHGIPEKDQIITPDLSRYK